MPTSSPQRHVLGDNPSVIESTLSYTLSFNGKPDMRNERQRLTFEVMNDPRNWAVHPDLRVDVAVLDITSLLDLLLQQCHVRLLPTYRDWQCGQSYFGRVRRRRRSLRSWLSPYATSGPYELAGGPLRYRGNVTAKAAS